MTSTAPYRGRFWKTLLAFPHAKFAISTTLLLFLCLIIWANMPQGMFAGTDGRLYKNLIAAQINFAASFSLNSINPLQGMGNLFIPMNVWLHPAYLPFHFFAEGSAALLSTVVSWLALVVSSYFLSRRLGIGETPAILAAQMATVLFFPFQYEFDLGINYLLNPGVAFITALVITCLALLVGFADDISNRRHGTKNLLLLFITITFGILCDPIWFTVNAIFFLPFIAITALPYSSRTRWLILGSLASLAVVFYFLGIIDYIHNLLSYTARTFAPGEVIGHSPSTVLYSSVFLKKAWPLFIFLGLGLLLGIVPGVTKRQHVLAYCSAAYFVFLIGLGAIFVIADTWTFPVPAYAEFAVMPVWFIASVSGFACFVDWALKLKRSFAANCLAARPLPLVKNPDQLAQGRGAVLRNILRLVTIFGIPLLVLYYAVAIRPERRGIYIEEIGKVNPPAELLAPLEKFAIKRDSQFKGYIAELSSLGIISVANSGMIWNALWRKNIPTINEYSQLVTPFSHFFFSRLAAGNRLGGTNGIPIFEPSEKILDLIGVTAVVADRPQILEGYKLTYRYLSPNQYWNLYLYERSSPFSILSPKNWRFKGSLKEIYDEIQTSSFDPRETVLVGAPLGDHLSPVQASRLEIIRGGYRVTARTEGSALLVLPIQYSHCLNVETDSPSTPRLFRANGLQVGVMFKDAVAFDLSYNYGIGSSECKKQDIEDLRDAIKGLPKKNNEVNRHPFSALQLVGASEAIMKFFRATPIAEGFSNLRADFSSLPAYQFSAKHSACQPYAADTERYTGNPYLEAYRSDDGNSLGDAATWLPARLESGTTLGMADPFLGFGWGPIGRIDYVPFRRLAYANNEGLILLHTEKGKKYKVRLSYWMHVPQSVSSALTVSFNGTKTDAILVGREGEIAWREFAIDDRVTNNCNGWVELLISTRGNTSRPLTKGNAEWSGFHFLLKNVSIDLDEVTTPSSIAR